MSAISWFEIPVSNMDRAQKFYENIFGTELINMDNPNIIMRTFPVSDMMTEVSGALVYHEEFYAPSSKEGCLLYLNANPEVQNVLDKVEEAGGKILVPKTEIGEGYGYMAIIIDSEGNRIGLHSVTG